MTAMIVFVAGCKKDSNDPVNSGQFTYAGTSYNLSQGFLAGYGSVGNNSYGITTVLMSSGFQVFEINGIPDSVSGQGEVFIAAIYSSTENAIEPGVYSFAELGTAGTFEYSGVLIGYDAETDEAEIEDEVAGGTITVTKKGDIYGFSFNMTTVLGSTLKGDYSGNLKFYSDIDKKKALMLN